MCAVLAAAAPQPSAAVRTNYMADQPNITNINPSPNATAIVPVPGWNLAQPYPGLWNDNDNPKTAVGQGWTMRLNITANTSSVFDDDRKGWVTRQTIELIPPSTGSPGAVPDPTTGNWTIDSDTTETWSVLLMNFVKTSAARGPPINNQDGSCDGVFSGECVRGLQQTLADSSQARSGNYKDSYSLWYAMARCRIEGWGGPCKSAPGISA